MSRTTCYTHYLRVYAYPESRNLSTAAVISAMFWDGAQIDWGLQCWPKSNSLVHELSQNIRSGDDKWWNQVLEEARVGALSEDNYNWLHGIPSTCIRHGTPQFWYTHKHSTSSPCTCAPESKTDDCHACNEVKQRRCRVLLRREEEGWHVKLGPWDPRAQSAAHLCS